jgi:hypothetical protein
MNPALDHGLWPWVAMILFGFLPSEFWRMLSIFLARGVNESSPLLVWVRAVATALLAGVVARLLLTPSGALAAIPLWGRLGAMGVGLVVFAATRKSVFVAVICAEATLIAVGFYVG